MLRYSEDPEEIRRYVNGLRGRRPERERQAINVARDKHGQGAYYPIEDVELSSLVLLAKRLNQRGPIDDGFIDELLPLVEAEE